MSLEVNFRIFGTPLVLYFVLVMYCMVGGSARVYRYHNPYKTQYNLYINKRKWAGHLLIY